MVLSPIERILYPANSSLPISFSTEKLVGSVWVVGIYLIPWVGPGRNLGFNVKNWGGGEELGRIGES